LQQNVSKGGGGATLIHSFLPCFYTRTAISNWQLAKPTPESQKNFAANLRR
jgi:hypothetical protein